ncbi:hypothetical protein ILUMI_19292 [Ignelater luminosus]|uniref:Uncharacterized protein n=1 Tax=Ignelater luminosus TaxID=2038154 RepID=A0A8K0CJL2_IGNLU|nr:hypothetical protein ILUMI_19292 [Ignelater luminosus]
MGKVTSLDIITKVRSLVAAYGLMDEVHVEKKRAATTPAFIRVKSYDEGEKVWVRSVRREEVKWFPGVVTKIKSLLTVLVRVNGFTRFVHVDYLKPRSTSE